MRPTVRSACLVLLPWAIIARVTSGASAQEPRGAATSRLGELKAAITDVEAGRRTTPLIGEPTAGGDVTVTFLAKRVAGRAPRIVSDVTGWGEHVDGTFDFKAGTMTRVDQTEWYFLDAQVAPRARIEYLIAYRVTDYRLDPHNPRKVDEPPASELVLPGYVAPPELIDPPTSPAGTTREVTVESRALRTSCRLVVHTPAAYDEHRPHPVAVFLSGRVAPVSRIIDWLVAHGTIEPVVSVFVVPQPGVDEVPGATTSRRETDPAPSHAEAMRTFLSEELPSWLSSQDGLAMTRDRRVILAISYGAKDALDAALASPLQPDRTSCEAANPPEGGSSHTVDAEGGSSRTIDAHACGAYGGLGLLIPGRRIGVADIEAIGRPRDHRLRVAIVAGEYDQANVATARAVRQALVAAGDAVAYTEVPEGHSPRTWLNNLRVVLVSLFGRPAAAAPGAPSMR
jgi:hypothetical protein